MEVSNRYEKAMEIDDGAGSVVEMLLTAKEYGRKVMVVGNGGSAAIAEHAQNDLSKAVGVRAMSFLDSSLMTAMANDHGYDCAYERAIEQWADDGDVLIAISSSGKSPNILRAVFAARSCGCKIVSLSGFEADNPLRKVGDVNFYVPMAEYGFVESAHAVLVHFFTDSAHDALAKNQATGEVIPLRPVGYDTGIHAGQLS